MSGYHKQTIRTRGLNWSAEGRTGKSEGRQKGRDYAPVMYTMGKRENFKFPTVEAFKLLCKEGNRIWIEKRAFLRVVATPQIFSK